MSDATEPAPVRHADLLEMLEAPDLTKRERRELKRAARYQKRIETWEHRLANPSPRKLHRAVITILMMGACIWVLWLINGGGAPG